MAVCRKKLCIFQKNGACALGDTNHDENGMCIDCIMIPISDEIIKKYKQASKR